MGFSGVMLRGSGISWDLRAVSPCDYSWSVPFGLSGDCYDRYLVRIDEMRQSLSISQQVIGSLEIGSVSLLLHCGTFNSVYHSFEAPKGEMGVYLAMVSRFKVRAPGCLHLLGLAWLVRGTFLSDLIAVIGTIDIVFGEIDR